MKSHPTSPSAAILTFTRTPIWKHKVILTGSLDQRTAAELEDEIECLCEEGVTILTLDLRQLDAIDPVGAKAIAFRGAACRQRGRDFAVVPGSSLVHQTLAEAGAESLLADDPGELGALHLTTGVADGPPSAMSTVMVKNL